MAEKKEKLIDLNVQLKKLESVETIEELRALVREAREAGISLPPNDVHWALERIVYRIGHRR